MPDFKPIPTDPRFQNLTGQIFGRLTVCGYLGRAHSSSLWLCRCLCGNDTSVSASHLKSGHTQSCGCFRVEVHKATPLTHGESRGTNRTKEYSVWRGIITRCENPNFRYWADYGGRGIKVCERWRNSFVDFLADVGRAPSPKHSIDRINNDGDYEPSNVRWVTSAEQAKNRRSNILVDYNGNTVILAEACRLAGVDYKRTLQRIRVYGWSFDDAIKMKWRKPRGRAQTTSMLS